MDTTFKTGYEPKLKLDKYSNLLRGRAITLMYKAGWEISDISKVLGILDESVAHFIYDRGIER